ncbi:uncharacterized protein LOC131324723 [Rhododendron vialii]|uniref:uncharacterized protein LOC131324723 n=1 Tax=Rhododendron vialii TaxID=182163 RepID=UPI00265F48D5|nr:uncharacterized protein LOC131324723 [Rhododendron vialii]
MASPSTVSQSLLFKSQIFRHNLPIWKTTRTTKNDSRIPATRRFPRVRLLLLPPHLRLPRPCLQIRHFNLLCLSSLRPLLRARSPPLLLFMSSLADSNSTNNTTNTKTVRVVVKGRVQGVFYRNWTMENAKELGLKGWVRNRRNGSVEALFSGSTDKVQEMEQRCRRGPPAAMVTGLEVFPCGDDPGTGFERRSTV